jgi:hypothetical protein
VRVKPRIPVFDTIGHGFHFGLSRYFSLLRVTWLPALLAGAILAFELWIGIRAERGELKDYGHLPDYLGLVGGIPFYALLCIPGVAAYRMAVFNRPAPGGIAYFRFGGTELQFMAAQLVTTVYMMVYLIVAFLIVFGSSIGAYQLLAPPVTGTTAYAGAVGAEMISLMKRVLTSGSLSFLLLSFFGSILFSLVQPIVVAEHRIGVWKSLRLLWLGNGVRLTLVWGIVGITFLFMATTVYALLDIYGRQILSTFMPSFDKKNASHLVIAWSALTLVPAILVGTLALGVTAGINGYAYRLLMLRPGGPEK